MAARPIRTDGVSSAPLTFVDALECSTIVGFNIPPGCPENLSTRNNHDVYSCQLFMASKQLSNQPFGSVPRDRVSDFLAGRDAEASRTDLVGQGETGHEPAPQTGAPLVDPRELRPTTQFHRGDDTVSRLRPLARRRFNTVRPFLVCMRTRKP